MKLETIFVGGHWQIFWSSMAGVPQLSPVIQRSSERGPMPRAAVMGYNKLTKARRI
jgi:hypothetical protein